MSHSAGSGDTLARGAIRATYAVRDEKSISQKKWDEMFADFDPEAFQKKDSQKAVSGPKEKTARR
jgi:hypothetical protein